MNDLALERLRKQMALLRRHVLAPRVAEKKRQRREREKQAAVEQHVLSYARTIKS